MKIHILCDSPRATTGFSNVGSHIAEGLHKLGYNVVMTGFQTYYESEYYKGIEVKPLTLQYIDELSQYRYNIGMVNPDVAICIFNADNADQNMFAKAVKPTVWYLPVEGRNISDMMANDIHQVSLSGMVVAQCHWGQNEMKKRGIDSTVIYHGYDSNIFKKIDNSDNDNIHEIQKMQHIHEILNVFLFKNDDKRWVEEKIEIKYLKNKFNGKFVFGFCGANHGIRKRIERLLMAYSLFLKDNQKLKDKTVLVLKTMPMSVTSPAILHKIASELGIQDNVVFLYGNNNRLTDESMNIIYNTFDVNVTASSSEGFCLPVLESMAIGVPQIAPKCSSFVELVGEGKNEDKRGLLADKGEWLMIPDGSYRFEVNEQDLANKMKEMYYNDAFRIQCGNNAKRFAEQYTWDKVVREWDRLLRDIGNK